MKRRLTIFDEELARECDEELAEASRRAEQTGKSLQEVMAEMAKEEKAKEAELQSYLEYYIRMSLQCKATTLFVDTGAWNVTGSISEALAKVGGVKFGDIANIRISHFESIRGLWQHLLNLRQDIVWVVWDGVESVTDEEIQECIFYMLKREEYVPPTLYNTGTIDFSERKLILITKKEDETEVYPPYCRGRSMAAFVMKV